MTDDQIRQDIPRLVKQHEARLAKYRRNFNRYANNGARSEDIRNQYSNPLAYWNIAAGEDAGVVPNVNVIKSCIDTHVSKLSQTKVRPFFNPTVGTFATRKVCRQAQLYFDELFDVQKVYTKGSVVLRDADTFEVGHLWVDDESKSIKRVAPWEWYIDSAEYNFGHLTRGLLRFFQYPLAYLEDKIKLPDWKSRLEQEPWLTVVYLVYFDLRGGQRVEFLGDSGDIIYRQKIDYECPPVVSLYREPPIKGSYSVSMADDLYPIQRQIDTLCHRINLAVEMNPANKAYVPKGSNIKASEFSNEIGDIVTEYLPPPGGGTPVIISTPRAIDPQYIQLLEMFEQKAYHLAGISQLSAQAKKPSGLDSGVALQTVEDVESERHQVSLQAYIQFYKDLAETCIEVFPEKEDILPKETGRARVKWGEIKRQRKAFSIQFSAGSSLSKDPKVKLEQIEKLIQMGLINPDMATGLLEFPDLEGAYAITASSYDDCQRIIERAVEQDKYEIPFCANLKQLFAETANTLLRLDANDEDAEVLKRLGKLAQIVKQQMDAIVNLTTPPPAPPEPPSPPAPVPVQVVPPAGPPVPGPGVPPVVEPPPMAPGPPPGAMG